jgi:fatty acid CoA ligase FadD9
VKDALVRRARERLAYLVAEDDEIRRAAPSREAIEAIVCSRTTIESVAKAFALYAGRSCFREREPGGLFRSILYADVWARVLAFASGLAREGLVSPGGFVGISGFGDVDWVVADLACIYLAAVSVPLQTGMSPTDLKTILQRTHLRCVVCSEDQRAPIEAVLPECPEVQSLVVMKGELAESSRVQATRTMRTMRTIEQRGRERGIVPMVLPAARGEPDPLMTLYYTSGSTGTPKGAMVKESLLRLQWQQGFAAMLDLDMPELPYITLNYMPLNHGAGRGAIFRSILRGGTTYFVAKSVDMSLLATK